MKSAGSFCLLLATTLTAFSGEISDLTQLKAVGVSVEMAKVGDFDTLKVVKNADIQEFDEPTFARVPDVEFKDGTIEVKVLSRLAPNAPDFARGFIGIAFRIDGENKKFESIYIRPTNGRAEVQGRRNSATQYFSYPDYKFQRLRKEAPGMYESYADMGLDEWITIKVVVKGQTAQLYLNEAKHPVLIVNDLKLGSETKGSVGLFVDVGTEGHFRDLKITPSP